MSHVVFLSCIVCSSAKFLSHTHDISFHSQTFLSPTFAVHWIRWCFEPLGASRAEAVPPCCPIGWHQQRKWQWDWYGITSASNAVPKTYKMKKAWGTGDLGQFLWLGSQVLRQSPVIYIAVFVARASLYWLVVTTDFCDTSGAANIFHATNVWGWRHQAGKCWIMRGMPSVLQRRSDSLENNEGSSGRETSLSTGQVHWTQLLGLWLTFLPSLKFFVWAEIKNWCNSSGHGSLYLLSGSLWTLRSHATRSWLVSTFVPCCQRSLCASSLLNVLVHHSQGDVSSDFVSLHQLGKITRELQLQRNVRSTKQRDAGLY